MLRDQKTNQFYSEKIRLKTILLAFEKALRNMTRLQKMGGFPMGSKLDGSLMWSDRGESCPLFPDEFSLQGGTAKIASVYLEMYKIEPNPVYLQVALNAADALLAVQDEINGGFFYDGRRYQNGDGYQPHPRNYGRHAVFDDNVMQSCLSFLLDVYNLTGIEKYLNGFLKGMNLIFEVEKQGGGWPQRTGFPSYRYEDYVTLNDDSMEDIVFLLLKAYKMFPWERKYLDAAERAGQFLIRVQGNGGSEFQQGWAQQYYNDMPAWARNFEPPAICSSDTNQAIKILMELYLYTNNLTYLEPIPAAISWLNDSSTIITWIEDLELKVGWARLYELGTNLPIYGIANGGPGKLPPYVYNYNEARSGYNWRNTNANSSAEKYLKLQEFNNDTSLYLEWRNTPKDLNELYEEAEEAYNEMDASFFWLENGKIKDSKFADNAMKIIEYLMIAIK